MDQLRHTRLTPINGSCNKHRGPFAAVALELHKHGLVPIPLGGDEGNKPQVRFATLKRSPSRQTLEKWARQHGQANIGVLTGLSNLTVVDIDDPALLEAMLARFGNTPLQVETPRGGAHLYYRSGGERCADLRSEEGLAVDIKGLGGMVVAPPSIRPSGPHRGKQYGFVLRPQVRRH